MLNRKGFDLWANEYDKSVMLSEEAQEYPFAGYQEVLHYIYNIVKQKAHAKYLDIGFGTGILAKKLYEEGYMISGIDFSTKMIEIAKEKMPEANLIQYDFTNGLPSELRKEKFDYIVCTYAIHHLQDIQKIKFIKELINQLSPEGKLLIGDVAFETIEELEQCKIQWKDNWDNEESYPTIELLKVHFPSLSFEKISFCAGVIIFTH